MGHPEDVYGEFWDWFGGLSDDEAAEYEQKYPEPRSWRGKYKQIRELRK
jgi:hypothetical protein